MGWHTICTHAWCFGTIDIFAIKHILFIKIAEVLPQMRCVLVANRVLSTIQHGQISKKWTRARLIYPDICPSRTCLTAHLAPLNYVIRNQCTFLIDLAPGLGYNYANSHMLYYLGDSSHEFYVKVEALIDGLPNFPAAIHIIADDSAKVAYGHALVAPCENPTKFQKLWKLHLSSEGNIEIVLHFRHPYFLIVSDTELLDVSHSLCALGLLPNLRAPSYP